MPDKKKDSNNARLDRVVAEARRSREKRDRGYREQALRILPWVCGRCARAFDRGNVQQLTVHHRDHDHDNNPPDGSNWELLCRDCHDNEHARLSDAAAGSLDGGDRERGATHQPFAGLGEMLKGRGED